MTITSIGTTVNSSNYGLPVGGVGDAGRHAQFAVQFLRHMRNKTSDFDATRPGAGAARHGAAAVHRAAAALRAGAVTFKANTNLVIVDVTAKDKAGMAIEGLKAEDFTVLEDGKPQKISVFEFQKHLLQARAAAGVHAGRSVRAAGSAENHHHRGHARTDSVSRQAPDGLLLRFFLACRCRTSCARRTPRSIT